jgi:hypothetical protein
MDRFISGKKPDRTETEARSIYQLPGLLRSNKKGTPRAQLHGKKENESETSSVACETMGAEEEEDNNREETIDRACGRSYDGVRKSAAAQVRSQR